MGAVFRKWLDFIVPVVVLALAVTWRMTDPSGALQDYRLQTFDAFQRLAPRVYEDAPVRIIDIDEESLRRVGQWPWPRTVLAELVANATNAGAAAIAFDIVLSEPDRTSPGYLVKLWADSPELADVRDRLAQLPDNDAVLADIVGQAKNVVTGFVFSPDGLDTPPARKASFAVAGDDPSPYLPPQSRAILNLGPLEKAAAGNGSFNQRLERDGIIRRVPLLFCRRGPGEPCAYYPSLATEALRVAQNARTNVVRAVGASGEAAFGGPGGIVSIRVGQFVAPTDAEGNFWVHYTEERPERYVPAWKVLAEPEEAGLDGMILLVGTSAAGLKDQRSTPLNPALPGVEVHAQVIEQILTQKFLQRPDWADGAETLTIAVGGLITILLLRRVGPGVAGLVLLAAVGGAIGWAWTGFTDRGALVDPVAPTLALLMIYASGTAVRLWVSDRERREVRGAFARYLSPALVEKLAADPSRLKLGGERRHMTFLFSDIRGFTTFSESHRDDPQRLTAIINRLLTPLTEAILATGGTVDKYMGDGIMAFWNAPLDDPDHIANACRSALAMQAALAALNDEIAAEAKARGESFKPFAVGVGVNTGDAVVGNMGSTQRFDYSALGDTVNLASRLEGLSKQYGVQIVVGESSVAALPAGAFALLELDVVAVKGRSGGTRLFTLLGDGARAQSDSFRTLDARHQELLAAYRAQDWDQATALVAQCRTAAGAELEPLYDVYGERIAALRASPPGPDWNGVYVAESK